MSGGRGKEKGEGEGTAKGGREGGRRGRRRGERREEKRERGEMGKRDGGKEAGSRQEHVLERGHSSRVVLVPPHTDTDTHRCTDTQTQTQTHAPRLLPATVSCYYVARPRPLLQAKASCDCTAPCPASECILVIRGGSGVPEPGGY
eukprot:1832678-Rhodomonas_salina.4